MILSWHWFRCYSWFHSQPHYFDLEFHFPSIPQEKRPNEVDSPQVCWLLCSRVRLVDFFPQRSSGALKPGEMCLVLGCPGAGCTTFLKTIANQRQEYGNVSGQVLYAGMDAAEMSKFYKGEVVYNEEGRIDAYIQAPPRCLPRAID